MRVMAAGRTIDEKIVGVLHDVVEDTDWTFDALLAEGFPVHIIDALRCVTKLSDNEHYDEFIERVKTNPLAVAVKILASTVKAFLSSPLPSTFNPSFSLRMIPQLTRVSRVTVAPFSNLLSSLTFTVE